MECEGTPGFLIPFLQPRGNSFEFQKWEMPAQLSDGAKCNHIAERIDAEPGLADLPVARSNQTGRIPVAQLPRTESSNATDFVRGESHDAHHMVAF